MLTNEELFILTALVKAKMLSLPDEERHKDRLDLKQMLRDLYSKLASMQEIQGTG